jgi:hypothetical protein
LITIKLSFEMVGYMYFLGLHHRVIKSIINLLLIHRKAKNLVYALQTIAFTNADQLLIHRKAKNLVYALQTC